MLLNKNICNLGLLIVLSQLANAQTSASYMNTPDVSGKLVPYKPSRAEMLKRYQHAALMDSITKNTVFKTSVQPYWQENGNTFWYRNTLKDSVTEYILVDAAKRTKTLAFDHQKLATALSKTSGKNIDSKRMK